MITAPMETTETKPQTDASTSLDRDHPHLSVAELGARNRLNLIDAQCCLCKTEDSEKIAMGEDFEYRTSEDKFEVSQCRECALVYLNPRPDISEFEKIYPKEYHAFEFSEQEFGLVFRIRRKLEAKRLLGWCAGLKENARILDVGCGDGFHLGLLEEFGEESWELEGIDLDQRAVDIGREQGLNIRHGSLETLALPHDHYDLIILVQTLEHVAEPVELLRKIRTLLRPRGRLVVVTDNTGSLDFRLFKGRYWGGYHFPRHWYLFNPSAIKRLARLTEFEVDNLTTQVSPVNWTFSIHNWLVDSGAPIWLRSFFSLRSPIALSFFTVFDMFNQLFGQGALIRASLCRPAEPAQEA